MVPGFGDRDEVSRSDTSRGFPVETLGSLADKVLRIFVKVWIVMQL